MRNPLECKQNVFLTGQAGTGKTYMLNHYIEEHEDDTLVCASTGTAAVSIGGTTMHRLFQIPVPAYGANPEKVKDQTLQVFKDINTVIIDEISMCRNDVFAYAIKVLKKAERKFDKKIRLIVCGDFSQLPPVVKQDDIKFLKKYGFDPSGYAFTTQEWKGLKFKVVELSEIKRQDNKEFIKALGDVRAGSTASLDYFRQFVNPDGGEGILVCGTNAEADRINKAYLQSLDTETRVFYAEKEGFFSADLPSEENMELKVGARVMFTANDSIRSQQYPLGRYQNGTFGYVKSVTGDLVVETDEGKLIHVDRHTWSFYNYKVERKTGLLVKEPIGSYTQYPLRIAKAITIHKSQGKTFTKVVIAPQSFAAGQLYVALSRVKSPEGLTLLSEIKPEYLITDEIVSKFYSNNYSIEIPTAQSRKRTEITKKHLAEVSEKKKTKRSTKAVKKKPAAKTKTGVKKEEKKSSSAANSKSAVKRQEKEAKKSSSSKTASRRKIDLLKMQEEVHKKTEGRPRASEVKKINVEEKKTTSRALVKRRVK